MTQVWWRYKWRAGLQVQLFNPLISNLHWLYLDQNKIQKQWERDLINFDIGHGRWYNRARSLSELMLPPSDIIACITSSCCDNMQWDGTREGQTINIPVLIQRHEPLIGQTLGVLASDWSIIYGHEHYGHWPSETIPTPGMVTRQRRKKWRDMMRPWRARSDCRLWTDGAYWEIERIVSVESELIWREGHSC